MSTAVTTTTQFALPTAQHRARVHCHQCFDEWYNDEHGLICPGCSSPFTEIIDEEARSPVEYPPERSAVTMTSTMSQVLLPETAPFAPMDDVVLMDDYIMALMLQMEEAATLGQNGKGKFPVGQIPDAVSAFDCFQSEIEAHMSFLNDVKLARSIAQAFNTDEEVIAALTTSEVQAQQDHEYALLVCEQDDELEFEPTLSFMDSDDDITPWFQVPPTSDFDEEGFAGPSATYAERQASALTKLGQQYQCSACLDEYYAISVIEVPCGDRYCKAFLKEMFLHATKGGGFTPPRCCSDTISIALVRDELSPTELDTFRKAELEYITQDRTYCSRRGCGVFIPPERIVAGKATRPRCRDFTCAMCKTEFHEDDDCPADEDLQDTLDLADEKGWQRCGACRQVVELDHGCNHMT